MISRKKIRDHKATIVAGFVIRVVMDNGSHMRVVMQSFVGLTGLPPTSAKKTHLGIARDC
jgi:hypothetical protein